MVLEQKTYNFILDYETMERMKQKFEDYEDIVASTDGSSIKNPGRVSNI